MFGMPLELITMLGGSITGFFFKYLAQRAQERHDLFEMSIRASHEADDSEDRAAKRLIGIETDGGKFIRRFIVISILFGVILGPFLLSLLNIPTIVQVDGTSHSFLGLFGKRVISQFVEIHGFLMVPEIRQTLTAIVGFYFGQAAAKV